MKELQQRINEVARLVDEVLAKANALQKVAAAYRETLDELEIFSFGLEQGMRQAHDSVEAMKKVAERLEKPA